MLVGDAPPPSTFLGPGQRAPRWCHFTPDMAVLPDNSLLAHRQAVVPPKVGVTRRKRQGPWDATHPFEIIAAPQTVPRGIRPRVGWSGMNC